MNETKWKNLQRFMFGKKKECFLKSWFMVQHTQLFRVKFYAFIKLCEKLTYIHYK